MVRRLPGWSWRARRTSRGARAASAATTDEVRRAGRAPGVGRRRREERSTIWQRGCRRAPPDRSPQPPWLLGQPPGLQFGGGLLPGGMPPRAWLALLVALLGSRAALAVQLEVLEPG